ncbi:MULTISPECIES: HAD family hydrolase [unclassified Sulfitobacter]|uniref:HAD family hydrolase n=1 Tax=unclassified Sulfitobacter TaxID=196795 RepID=UPI0007C38477|nr:MULTISPECIES: HAD family hydrolase [unclassified Sulfitobacter]KZY06249.1 phosphatase [Sulfitobacter sp. HI0023]KZY26011.1 phosphatase [Sulfitobacter sp. HI0040]KZZ65961.1 phosphatase [Sulfitobacter sp. HI0129]
MSGAQAAPAVRGIVFDKDGTLFDFAATWEAWAVAFLLRAAEGDAARAQQVGAQIGFDFAARRFARDSIVIAGTPGEVATALAPHFPDTAPDALLAMLNDEAAQAPQQEAVPLRAFLQALRDRGLRLGLATNDAEAPARLHLERANVTDLFDFVAGFDSGHGGKPEPGQLRAFCAAMGLEPAEVVMVGDSLHDLHAGKAAGMRTLGVLTGLAEREDLAPDADAVLPDIGHIPAWLDGLAPA